jgi:hypothetical protein
VHLKKLHRAEGGANFFWVFRVKNHHLTPNILFFPILGGGGPRRVRLPLDPPLYTGTYLYVQLLTVSYRAKTQTNEKMQR